MLSDRASEVVVIGGGVVGCAISYELAKRGIDVMLVERDRIGCHSTAKNAGGVRKQFSSEVTVRMQVLSLRLLDEFENELGISPGFRKIGYLFVLSNEQDAAAFRRYLTLWRGLGLNDACWMTPDDVRQLVPIIRGDDVVGGTFCESDGIASPADVTYGYVAGARRLGVRVLENCEVVGLDTHQGRIARVLTTQGAISCGHVFICAGAWSRQVGRLASVNIPVDPHRRHIFVTGPVHAVKPKSPMTIDFASSFYFHPEGPGVLFGMSVQSEPSFSTETDWSILEQIEPVMRMRAPAFLDAEIRGGWAGLYEVTPDHQPILGPIHEICGLWAACGFSGHGFMQAPAVGVLLAQQFLNEDPLISLESFSYNRFLCEGLDPEQAVV